MNRTAEVVIGGRTFTVSPLKLGGYKRQHEAMNILNRLYDRSTSTPASAELPGPEEVDAMVLLVADSIGLFPEKNDALEVIQRKAAELQAFTTLVDGLDFLTGIAELSRATVAVMKLNDHRKDKQDDSGAAAPGEVVGS